jgi:hypothetical protein
MFSHIITFGSSLPELLGGHSLCAIICERVLIMLKMKAGNSTLISIDSSCLDAILSGWTGSVLCSEQFAADDQTNQVAEAVVLCCELSRDAVDVWSVCGRHLATDRIGQQLAGERSNE